MKKRFATILAMIAFSLAAQAQQRYADVLATLQDNSPAFRALSAQRDAAQADALSGALLGNPEVEFGFYWGDPSNVGRRWDLKVMQPFDMPQAYVHRNRIRKLLSQSAVSDYDVHRAALLLEAQNVCSDLVYYNAYVAVYSHCVKSARELVDIYAAKVERGESSILDYNLVQMNLASIENKLRMAETERDMMADNLQMLNGGNRIVFTADSFAPVSLPADFDTWFNSAASRNPTLESLRQQQRLSQEEIKLAKAEWWPKFAAGYASENVVGETFRGVAIQATIPLWQQKGTLKRARSAAGAAQALYEQAFAEHYNRLQGLYRKAQALNTNLHNLQQTFATYNSEELLARAFEAGEIRLEDYLRQVEFYHDSEIAILEIQHELEQTILQLEAYCL